ncbi:MAG: response regulator, partial [Flavobacterium sp.]|nr:response regulator [Flavobacterium sp.]
MAFLKENILIVDDDINILEVLYRHLASYNYHVYKAVSVKEAVSILRDNTINLLITDLKMPEIDGFELIKFTTDHYPKLPILVVTGYPSIQDSLLAIKSGVVEYLTKPFTKEELETSVKKTLKTKNKTITNNSETLKSNFKNEELIGNSKKILEVFDIIERVKNN